MKRLLALLLVFIVVTVTLPFTASAIVLVDDKYGGDQLTSGNFKYVIKNKEVSITDVVASPSGSVVIPAKIASYPVTSINRHAFVKCKDISSVTLPEGLKEIYTGAFKDCTSLKSINIPSTVTKIYSNAFVGCKSLSEVHITSLKKWCEIDFWDGGANPLNYAKNFYVNEEKLDLNGNFAIPDGVIRIGDGLFRGIDSITSVTIPLSVTSIGHRAFDDCTGLKSVYITSLYQWCRIDFDYCSNPLIYADTLYVNDVEVSGNLVIPDGIMKIKQRAFIEYDKITSVTFSSTVTFIEDFAFSGCGGLTTVTIPDTVKRLGEAVFSNCTSLKSITLPNTLTVIGDRMFKDCTSLESIVIPEGVTSIGEYAFLDCAGLTSVTLPDSLITIEKCAFWDCGSLTNVVIPNNVTAIDNYAFRYCSSLESITIPDSVTHIGEKVFEGCDNLNFDTDKGSYAHKYADKTITICIVTACVLASAVICAVVILLIRKKRTPSDTAAL